MSLTLYKLDASAPVRSVYMTIRALNITDVEYIDVNLLEGDQLNEDFVKINPQHTVPVLKDGDFYIWDSHAICAYLVTKFGNNDSLYPTDLRKRAVVDQRLHFDSGILFPTMRRTVDPIVFGGDKTIDPENINKITLAYEFAEKFLMASPWLAGDHVTLADICCISTISSLAVFLPIDAQLFPNLADWFQRCSEQDFYKKVKRNLSGLQQFSDLVHSNLS